MRIGKNFRMWGVRGSLLGDCIGALTVLNSIEQHHPGSFKYWQVAAKCSHIAPLFIGHPLIDRIVISDCPEGMGPRDREIAATCDIVFNVMPEHPWEQDYPNHRDFYHETFIMSGLGDQDYFALPPEQRLPKLVKWFRSESRLTAASKIIAIWPQAGYGKEPKRSPGQVWYQALVDDLISRGYDIIQFGHPADFELAGVCRRTHIDFFQQVRETLSCDLVISTDSGSGLIFAAYEHPQITLTAPHWPGHVRNLDALAPKNRNGHVFVGVGSADRISKPMW
jgi:ADP-heptose:LPS heptosyltransferase